MKTSGIYSGMFTLLLFMVAFFLPMSVLAQNQFPNSVKHGDAETFRFAHLSPTLPHINMARPSLSSCGKGLPYYDCIVMKNKEKTYVFKVRGEETPIITKTRFTELELEMMNQNLLFINKQSQIQIKEWIRKEKWDLNLGEMIKGFYMYPVF